jgi:1-acyl-sn-glycerol-3-phosphate acyltransferase
MATRAEPAPPPDRAGPRTDLPRRWHWLVWLFRRYSIRYVRRHFHAVRLSASGSPFPPVTSEPLLVVLNHPSWWDPMIGVVLSSLFRDRDHFAAIDAEAVRAYRFFAKLGFVGVETGSLRGAAAFLRAGEAALSRDGHVFWVTAQGRFSDVRERPIALEAGVGHLAAQLSRGTVLPLALEYAFWNERTPEALVRAGEPLRVEDHPGRTGKEWLAVIERGLTRTLDALSAEAMARDPAKFVTILDGRSGVGGPYDLWRRFRALVRGERFDPSHDAATHGRRP